MLQSAGFETVESIKQATLEDIAAIIGAAAAKKFFATLMDDMAASNDEDEQKNRRESHQSTIFNVQFTTHN
jgi:hypothetical protein